MPRRRVGVVAEQPEHLGDVRLVGRAELGERLLALCADSEALARVWPEPTDE